MLFYYDLLDSTIGVMSVEEETLAIEQTRLR